MIINITYGKGTGKSKLSAFDAALWDAGIGDYNLITLSSIIPPNSKVEVRKLKRNDQEIGNKLYIVLSRCYETSPSKIAYAGLGWVIKEDGSGIFMEECGSNEGEVKRKIKDSLESAINYREGSFGSINSLIEKIRCENKPVCVVIAAVYKSEDWS